MVLIWKLSKNIKVMKTSILLGANFLRKFYTIYDMGKMKMGIYGDHEVVKFASAFSINYTFMLGLVAIALTMYAFVMYQIFT